MQNLFIWSFLSKQQPSGEEEDHLGSAPDVSVQEEKPVPIYDEVLGVEIANYEVVTEGGLVNVDWAGLLTSTAGAISRIFTLTTTRVDPEAGHFDLPPTGELSFEERPVQGGGMAASSQEKEGGWWRRTSSTKVKRRVVVGKEGGTDVFSGICSRRQQYAYSFQNSTESL